jgi:hypothetical protein
MPPLSYELINHLREMQPALLSFGLQASLNVRNFSLTVSDGHRSITLYPQFTEPTNTGVVVYTAGFSPAVKRFIGWRPDYSRQWPLAAEKLAFKAFMTSHGLPTPRHSEDPNAVMQRVIVKKNESTFSEGIRGPFADSAGVALNVHEREYFEEFTPGHIIKIWYWNSEPVAVEETEMLSIIGDGMSSIADIIQVHAHMLGLGAHDLAQYEAFLAYQRRDLGTVLGRGELCAIDFRYNCELPTLRMHDIRIGTEPFHGHEGLLKRAGRCLWSAIPAAHRNNVVFTVDAMLDPDKNLWFLELNSNPYVHPYVYPHMMRSIKEMFDGKASAHAG